MSSRIVKWVPGILAAGATVGILAWLLFDSPGQSTAPSKPVVRAKVDPAAIDPPAPPLSQPIVAASKDEPLFAEAMNYYRKGDYTRASFALQQATAKQPENQEIRFFLGVCYLLAGDTHAGIRELRVARGLEDSPYVDQIHFYLAKAFLRQKDTTNATRELDALVDHGGNFAAPAKELKVELANTSIE